MTLHHAVEITLTRPATRGDLRDARRGMLLAASADRTRLLTVYSARRPGGVLHALRRHLEARLPVDVLTTHYPNRHGQILLNVALHQTADDALRQAAAVLGQRPEDVLRQTVADALARDAQRRTRQLQARLENLLADHTPDEVLVGVADLLHDCRHPSTRTAL
ncbi:hypothetical protein ACIOC2_36390 [Streptomyces sp. NPDC088337]|uniref:hypothetical protein n=1 Tax=unclassified Streptomyces TaxID=2593676 RepID=UPI003813FC58